MFLFPLKHKMVFFIISIMLENMKNINKHHLITAKETNQIVRIYANHVNVLIQLFT